MSTRPPPHARASRSRSARRAELLGIAADLFAARGFAATTVREIADAAGILSGSLYHHFDSKESMVDEILRTYLDAQREAFARVMAAETDPRSTIAELIRESFSSLHRHRSAVAILHNEARHLSRIERFGYLRSTADEFERTWTRVLRDGQRQGVFRAEFNTKLAYRFIRDTVGATVQWYNPRGRLSLQSVTEQYVTLFCNGIVV